MQRTDGNINMLNYQSSGLTVGLKIKGWGVVISGHNLPTPMVEIGITDLPKSGGPLMKKKCNLTGTTLFLS